MIATVEKQPKTGNLSKTSRRKTGLKPLIEILPPDSTLILTEQTWENYERLLNEIGEAGGLRISFDKGNLEITTLSNTHESYSRLIEKFIGSICTTSRIDIASFGSATIKNRASKKVQSRTLVSTCRTPPRLARKSALISPLTRRPTLWLKLIGNTIRFTNSRFTSC